VEDPCSQQEVSKVKPLASSALLLLAALTVPLAAPAEPRIGTLTLDGLSFVSFGSQEIYSIPAGSTMRFQFGPPRDGQFPITVEPQDLTLGELRLRSGGAVLQLGLVRRAFGYARRGTDGSVMIELDAVVSGILKDQEHGGAKTLRIHLTTEAAEATGSDGLGPRSVSGMRPASGSRGIQLVGAIANDADTYPAPGAAVLVVLSGVFDELPL
jgi:hypothetical protein